MARLLAILLIAILLTPTTKAQEQFVDPPSVRLTSFPFRLLTGGVILFRAQFDEYNDTLQFILDTGSGGISLDSSTVRKFNLIPEPSDRTVLGIGGIKKVGFLYNRKFRLPGLVVDSLNFHVNDYDILTSVYGEKIDGIVGYSFLSKYIVSINYDSLVIDVFSNGRFRYPKGGSLLEPSLRTLPVQNARIKDNITAHSRFLFDIGAGLCLLLSSEFVEDSSFLHRKRVLYVKEAEGLGGSVDMHLTVTKEIKIGPYKFRNVPTFVFDDVNNLTSYPFLAGIIGNDLMRRFNIILNYNRREFYITPNKHYNDFFDYSYTGVELYFEKEGVVLGDVAKGSPAEQAGLREGDIVIAINNNFSQNLQQFKQELQHAGQKIKMVISREGQLLQFEFKIKSIR
ncbi:MAG: aspartyl protease family protein [Chitinophagaceae bacterium]|nr:aspartyl protease family protein [Chitinophagaceae bacterium]